jgi:hypothetical protein
VPLESAGTLLIENLHSGIVAKPSLFLEVDSPEFWGFLAKIGG